MSDLVRCNICFRQPGRTTSRFAITNCGHVFCERCLQTGKKDECGVCKSPCRSVFLSNQTDPEIKMLFVDINVLCKKFSNEFTQIVEFQGSHRNRMLAHYKRKIAKLEGTIKELTQELQSVRVSQQYSRLPTSNLSRNTDSMHSEDQYSPTVSQVSNAKMVELMNFTSTAPRKKNMTIAGPNRLSLISPPPGGLMGPHKSNTTGGSLRSTVGSSQHNIFHPLSQPISPASHGSTWNPSSLRSPQQFSPLPSQPPSARQPITLANILLRRH